MLQSLSKISRFCPGLIQTQASRRSYSLTAGHEIRECIQRGHCPNSERCLDNNRCENQPSLDDDDLISPINPISPLNPYQEEQTKIKIVENASVTSSDQSDGSDGGDGGDNGW